MAGMKTAECHCITNSAAPMPDAVSFHNNLQRATTDRGTGNVPSAGAIHKSGVTQMETHSGMAFWLGYFIWVLQTVLWMPWTVLKKWRMKTV